MLALSAENIGTDQVDLDQMIAVARMFAERGDDAIKKSMYGAVKRVGFDTARSCYEDLIALDGIEALIVASEEFPEAIDESDIWIVDTLIGVLEARDGNEEARVAIEEACLSWPRLKVVVERMRGAKGTRLATEEPVRQDYASLKLAIQSKSKLRILSQWGRSAGVEELSAAADDLIKETDRNRLLTYLSIFRKVCFPGSIDRLLELAENVDGRIARAAILVLAQISDPRIRNLLLKLMDIEDRCGDAVELMASNFSEGDFRRIEDSLRGIQDTDSLHYLGMGVRHLLTAHCPPDAIDTLLFLYENGPCSLCRGEFVERLVALDSIPEWMRKECQFDADLDTRKLVL